MAEITEDRIKMGEDVIALVQAFVAKHQISCGECVHQNDAVIIDATRFIEKLCDRVGYHPIEDEE